MLINGEKNEKRKERREKGGREGGNEGGREIPDAVSFLQSPRPRQEMLRFLTDYSKKIVPK